LHPPRKTGESAALAQGTDPVAAPRYDLVRIGLMTHVPDKTIPGRVEQVVQRYGELDDTKARTEMPAGNGHRIDRFLAQRDRELRKARLRQAAQVVGRQHLVEQRRP